MVLTLLAITFVSAAAVGTIYEITQEPIAAAKSAKIGSAVALVVPPFDNNPDETKTIDSLDGKTVTVYTACRDRTRSDMRSRHFPTADSAVKSA